MTTWQFIILLLWIYFCTRHPGRPDKSKADRERDEKIDFLLSRANFVKIAEAMEGWGLFRPFDLEAFEERQKRARTILENYGKNNR